MPLYDFECTACGKEVEIFCCINDLEQRKMDTRCPSCQCTVKQVIKAVRPGDWFREHVNYDFDGTPIQVTSKRHYRELCRKFNVQARALM